LVGSPLASAVPSQENCRFRDFEGCPVHTGRQLLPDARRPGFPGALPEMISLFAKSSQASATKSARWDLASLESEPLHAPAFGIRSNRLEIALRRARGLLSRSLCALACGDFAKGEITFGRAPGMGLSLICKRQLFEKCGLVVMLGPARVTA
jgi:hypothetical protein